MQGSPFLVESEAAEVLRCSPKTLANKRHAGTGPPYLKTGGRVLYDHAAVIEWARSKARVSTSDRGHGSEPA